MVGEELALNRFLLREKAYDIRREQGTLPEFVLQSNTHVDAALIFRKKMGWFHEEEIESGGLPEGESASREGTTKMTADNGYPLLPNHVRATALKCITTAGDKPYVKASLVGFLPGHREALVEARFLRKSNGGNQYFFVSPYTKLLKGFRGGTLSQEQLAQILQVGTDVEPQGQADAGAEVTPAGTCPRILLGDEEISLGATKLLLKGLSESGAQMNNSVSEGSLIVRFGEVALTLPLHPSLK